MSTTPARSTSSAPSSRAPTPGPPTMTDDAPRPVSRVSPNRIVGFALLAFAIALVVHGVIILLGGGDSFLRFFVSPIIGAAVMFFGLRGYPTAGRIRLAAMVAVCLLL